MNHAATILTIVIIFAASIAAQTTPPKKHPGVVLFEQAKYKQATKSLEVASKSKEYRNDPEVWNYLGLSYVATGDWKKARKAFEKSVAGKPGDAAFQANLAYAHMYNGDLGKALTNANEAIRLDPKSKGGHHVRAIVNLRKIKLDPAEADADTFIRVDPTNVEPYLLKSEVLIAKLAIRVGAGNKIKEETGYLRRAVDTLTLGAEKAKGSPRYAELQEELAAVTAFRDYFERNPGQQVTPVDAVTPSASEQDVTPFKILVKTPAKYTERARLNNIQGTIKIAALLGVKGRIEQVLFLSRLGFGLEGEVMKAVSAIRFEPKKKNGVPVPAVAMIEYSFSIY